MPRDARTFPARQIDVVVVHWEQQLKWTVLLFSKVRGKKMKLAPVRKTQGFALFALDVKILIFFPRNNLREQTSLESPYDSFVFVFVQYE